MPFVLLLFVALPIIEIAVLLKVGAVIGWLPTLVIVILTAIIGTAMLRQQGVATLTRARNRLDAGQMPAEELLEGIMLAIGGALLLTPGFVTDTFGFLCLFPVTRKAMIRRLIANSSMIVATSSTRIPPSSAPGGGAASATRRPSAGAGKGSVIEGEFEEVER